MSVRENHHGATPSVAIVLGPGRGRHRHSVGTPHKTPLVQASQAPVMDGDSVGPGIPEFR